MKTLDVAVVGGGIIGATVAFELARRSLRVVLLERQQPGREASWAAAGMLSAAPDSADSIYLLPLAKASLDLYPKFIAEIEGSGGHATGFRREGALQLFLTSQGENERDSFIEEHHQRGLKAEPITIADARAMEPSIGPAISAAAWLPEEASVDPRALTQAILAAARSHGTEIRTGVEVTSVVLGGDRCTGVIASGVKISAGHVVIAAGAFTAAIDPLKLYAPTRPVRGQMIALRPVGAPPYRVLRSENGYLVPRLDGRIVAGSTLEDAGFDKRVTPSGLVEILNAAIELVPSLSRAEIIETWSGLRPDTPDHLPVLGPTDLEGLYMATGHYRNGILLAPITAKLICEWLTGREPSLKVDRFSPLRFVEAMRGANS
jgi:glycine oxidase